MNTVEETVQASQEDMSKFIVGIHGRPYMTVAGRVVLMHHEAEEKGADVLVDTAFQEFAGKVFCLAKVRTSRGIATGHAEVIIGGSGVDATSPFENAETSAVGRALGFLGYGDVSGIASADEVIGAKSRENGQRTVPDMSGPPMGNVEKPASERQISFIRSLADKDLGWAPGETEAFVASIKTSRQASSAIEKMRQKQDPRANRPGGQEARSEAPAYSDDDIPADDEDPFPSERVEMDASTRAAFFAELNKVSRWKEGYKDQVRAYIQGQGWGTPENPGTTKYLNGMQRKAVLELVANLEGPAWTDLFGDDALKPETPWYSLVKWFAACKVEPWDAAMYLMAEFGDNAPAAKHPSDFPPELVQTIAEGIKNGSDVILGDIKDHMKQVRTF